MMSPRSARTSLVTQVTTSNQAVTHEQTLPRMALFASFRKNQANLSSEAQLGIFMVFPPIAASNILSPRAESNLRRGEIQTNPMLGAPLYRYQVSHACVTTSVPAGDGGTRGSALPVLCRRR